MERRDIINHKDGEFSIREQCRLLDIHRSGFYYIPKEVSEEELASMRAIDEAYLKHPYYGRRRMTLEMKA